MRGVAAGLIVSVIVAGAAVIGCELVAGIDVHDVLDACTPIAVDEAAGLFVSTAGKASGCNPASCTRDAPCSDLSDALCVAASRTDKNKIYVASGTYTGSVDIALDRDIDISGGWDPNFAVTCDTSVTPSVIVGEDGQSAVTITGSANVTLRSFVIDAGAAPSGGSSYGVFVATQSSPTITLNDVSVTAPVGSNGGAGATGSDGAPASDAGCAGDPKANWQGVIGVVGDGGMSGTFGTFDSTGYHPVTGGVGATGGDGGEGAPGSAPDIICCYSGVQCSSSLIPKDGNPGIAGCGGSGGGGGAGGVGGGGSFAVYAWRAQIVTVRSTLTANAGGVGGPGGAGGAGGAPTAGRDGDVTKCNGYTGQSTCAPSGGTPCDIGVVLDGGAAGGPGGPGGNGGPGGAGANGPSCAIVIGGGSTANVDGHCTSVVTAPNACNGELGTGHGCK